VSADLRSRLHDAPVPGAEDARRRAWGTIRSAKTSAPPALAADATGRRRHGRAQWRGVAARRRAVAALLAAAGVALAASPPGAAVGEWVRARVDPPATVAPPATPAIRLPAPGRLLVGDALGITVVGHGGDRVRLGRYAGATWSPNGWFAAAWRGNRLSALTPGGAARWTITAPSRIVTARWSPDPGYRVAYATAAGWLHVVNGDGTGDRLIARAAARPAPAWRPGSGRTELAYVTPAGRLVLQDTDHGAPRGLPRRALPRQLHTLTWSPDGRRLIAAGARETRTLDLRRPAAVTRRPAPPRTRVTAAAYAPTRPLLARATRARQRANVLIGRDEVYATRGRIAGLAWSPDGRWLMLDTPDAGQLVAIRVVGRPRVLGFPGGRLHGWSR
jgi:hypothetical protein